MIPYGRQNINEEDISSVIEVLKSDFLTQGPQVPIFEEKVSSYVGVQYATAVNSATSALHIACLSMDLGPEDIVWTSPNSFVASANCALYCGASVDFVDIDSETYNMCPLLLEEKLLDAEKKNALPKIVIPVHLSGQSCDMQKIKSLSKRFGFKIIEDASHAIGGKYKDKPVGSCDYSDITVFSFHPVKIITTCEGGMAVTNNPELDKKMKLYRTHGITRDSQEMSINPGPWYYEQKLLGFNYRMTDIHAALGTSQIKRLDSFILKRHDLAKKYNESFDGLPIKIPKQINDSFSSYHLYIIRIDMSKLNVSYSDIFNALRTNGVGVNLHYLPIHTHPFFQDLGFKEGDFPESEKFSREAISIPMFPDLTDGMQSEVILKIKEIF